ncbi:Mitochondrial substrate carrier family protein B [Tritrichomonas foetus]|uniref:Mitochondrial substrate carrier family protein B n=1 Tax=Tritrichomonas foetus TaxID=1144522 RepID=A0A1J4JD30_9EUKA|nr:Mitochondrial substrate carrier family protein B [Tritrichomonas foetus]|eukprot:OHS96175.1 Mitochondrial substrate carrier family protein B [Tritrichomonas foetus]
MQRKMEKRKADEILYATSPKVLPHLKLTRQDNFICGTLSGFLARTLTSPLDVIKLLIQVGTKGESISSCCREIYKRDGIRGFWNGNAISVINQGFYSGIKFFIVKEIHDYTGKSVDATSLESAITGGVAGVISQIAVFPLDLIRTRIIVQPSQYKGFFHACNKIARDEGITSLWSGLLPTIVGSIPYESSQYLVYGQLRQFAVNKSSQPLTPLQNVTFGTIAGIASATITYPFENVRKMMMITDENGNKLHTSMIGCMKSVFKTEGIHGLYKGVALNAIKVIPYSALQYTLYDEVCKLFIRAKKIVYDE